MSLGGYDWLHWIVSVIVLLESAALGMDGMLEAQWARLSLVGVLSYERPLCDCLTMVKPGCVAII